jgi:hypothetical protein
MLTTMFLPGFVPVVIHSAVITILEGYGSPHVDLLLAQTEPALTRQISDFCRQHWTEVGEPDLIAPKGDIECIEYFFQNSAYWLDRNIQTVT